MTTIDLWRPLSIGWSRWESGKAMALLFSEEGGNEIAQKGWAEGRKEGRKEATNMTEMVGIDEAIMREYCRLSCIGNFSQLHSRRTTTTPTRQMWSRGATEEGWRRNLNIWQYKWWKGKRFVRAMVVLWNVQRFLSIRYNNYSQPEIRNSATPISPSLHHTTTTIIIRCNRKRCNSEEISTHLSILFVFI